MVTAAPGVFVPSVINNDTYVHAQWGDMFPNPYLANVKFAGDGGFGFDASQIHYLKPSLLAALIWLCVRVVSKKLLFPMLGAALGINPKRTVRIAKFGYQGWLFVFYTLSSVFGYYILHEDDYFGLPVNGQQSMNLFNNHPGERPEKHTLYYNYQLGFYFAELFAIFVETKRSDFGEYVVHHIATIILVVGSFCSFDHRFGAMIFLLHDMSDVFLSLAKTMHYAKFTEGCVNVVFACFVASFLYLRLYCFPCLIHVVMLTAPLIRPATVWYWCMAVVLWLLQLLHVYWLSLIVKMLARIFSGSHGDVRSDEDEEPAKAKKTKRA